MTNRQRITDILLDAFYSPPSGPVEWTGEKVTAVKGTVEHLSGQIECIYQSEIDTLKARIKTSARDCRCSHNTEWLFWWLT